MIRGYGSLVLIVYKKHKKNERKMAYIPLIGKLKYLLEYDIEKNTKKKLMVIH